MGFNFFVGLLFILAGIDVRLFVVHQQVLSADPHLFTA